MLYQRDICLQGESDAETPQKVEQYIQKLFDMFNSFRQAWLVLCLSNTSALCSGQAYSFLPLTSMLDMLISQG